MNLPHYYLPTPQYSNTPLNTIVLTVGARCREHYNAAPVVLCHYKDHEGVAFSPMWENERSTYNALHSIHSVYGRALGLLYDNVHFRRPNTVLGELWDTAEPILGNAHRLCIMNPYVDSAVELTYMYRKLRKRQMGSQERGMSFLVGAYVRGLYRDAHVAFYNSLHHTALHVPHSNTGSPLSSHRAPIAPPPTTVYKGPHEQHSTQ